MQRNSSFFWISDDLREHDGGGEAEEGGGEAEEVFGTIVEDNNTDDDENNNSTAVVTSSSSSSERIPLYATQGYDGNYGTDDQTLAFRRRIFAAGPQQQQQLQQQQVSTHDMSTIRFQVVIWHIGNYRRTNWICQDAVSCHFILGG